MIADIENATSGIYLDVPNETYHRRKLGVVSKSAIDEALQSPAHYKAWVESTEDRRTPALVFGSAIHAAVLEPAKFASKYVVQPDFGDCRNKENKANRDAWREENEGKEALSEEDMAKIRGTVASIYRHTKARPLISGGLAEVTVKWTDPATELQCKARADYYREDLGVIVDLKSTEDASEEAFKRSVANYGYHRQDAFYRRGFSAVGKPVTNFVFIAVEKTPPYAVGVYVLDDEAIAKGNAQNEEAMARIARGVRTGEWPAYEETIKALSLPRWAA